MYDCVYMNKSLIIIEVVVGDRHLAKSNMKTEWM